jgi:hypothetical protein
MARRVTPSGRPQGGWSELRPMLQTATGWFQGQRPGIALGGPGQSPGLTSLPGSPGPETDMRSIAPANSPTSRYPGCDTAAQQIDAPERNAGTMPSPSYSHCKLNMPLGAMLCPTAFATLPPPKLCRPSPISISTSSPQLSHLVATGETDTVADSDNQQRQSTQQHTNSCQRQSAATMMPTKRSHRLHPD